jgi:peptide/nickel transport system substrate-binding protein
LIDFGFAIKYQSAGGAVIVMIKQQRRQRRILPKAAVALLALFFLSQSVQGAESRRGGTLRFGVSKNLTTLNPFLRIQDVDYWVRSVMFEGLLAHDKNLEPLPGLATSWTISPDGLVYAFTLRQGVRFHDKKSLTAGDVQWSIEYVQNPKNGAFGRSDLTVIEKVEAEEPDRLRIQLKSPLAPFLSLIAGNHVLPILSKDSLAQGDEKRDTYPPGTGPFRFVSWKPAQEVRVQRYEEYWQKGLPFLEEVRFPIVIDETARFTAVRSGDLDIVERVPPEQVQRIREGKFPGMGLALAQASQHPRMGINHCRPPFDNLKVRQAFAFAINKQEIIDGAYWGLGIPTNQKILRGTRWFAAEVPDRVQDIARARALLAEAGHPEGLKITVASFPGTEEELQIMQAQVKRAGIDMTILIRDFPTHIAALNKADFQISMSGGGTNSDPDLTYYAYYRTPPPERRQLGGRSQPCYSNARVDQLLDDARKITDFQRRKRLYKEVIEILHEEVADLPIAFVPNGFGFQRHVKDFEPAIRGTFSYANGGLLKTWMEK